MTTYGCIIESYQQERGYKMKNKNVLFKGEFGSMWLKAKIIKIVLEKDGYVLRCGGDEFFCKKERVKVLPIA
jgi:hypothetical protein